MRMTKIMKYLGLVAIAVLLVAISITACAPPQPVQQFTLRIGIFSAQDYLPYFVIQELGFAKQNNLQFVEKKYPGGAAIMEDMVTGAADVGIAGITPVISIFERGLIPSKVVPVAAGSFSDHDHPYIAVLVATTVNTWQDLHKQYISVNAFNGIPCAAIKGRLKQEGIEDYKLVEIPLANQGLALAEGNVAAITISEPYLSQSLLRKDGKLLDWIVGGPPFVRMQNTSIVFSTDFYKSNTEGVKSFLRAHLEAVKWINKNPEGARSILTKYLNVTSDIGQKMLLLRWPIDARNDPALLESMQPLLLDIGMLKAPIPASQLYDETLLNEVLSEKR